MYNCGLLGPHKCSGAEKDLREDGKNEKLFQRGVAKS